MFSAIYRTKLIINKSVFLFSYPGLLFFTMKHLQLSLTDKNYYLLERIAKSLEKIASEGLHITIDHGHIEHIDHVDHIDAIDHTHIDDIGEIHGDVITHPKKF